MRARRSWTLRLAVLLAGSAVSGCGGTMSLDMNYSPALYRLQQADQWRGIALGVAKLEDRRSWIDPTNPESLGYVMQQGAYAQVHPDMAGELRERKLAAIRLTGATVVASANPGCIIQLQGHGFEVRHPIELVAEAIS